METIYLNWENLAQWQEKAKPCVMALGFFDGLHNGHQEVVKTAIKIAKAKNIPVAVMSFFPHPKSVLSDGKIQVDYLMPLSEKEKRLQELGVDIFYIVEFTKEFAALSPEQYVAKYLLNLGVIHAVAGFDFSYGFKGAGNLERLKSDSSGIIEVTKVDKVVCRGEKISSTCIRERISNGRVDELPDFLGRYYENECNWDGESINILPYYTLPSAGQYAVTINKGSVSICAEVLVTVDEKRKSLKSLSEIPQYIKGEISIQWHYRIQKDQLIVC
ncbi:FAD synthetase family protein [Neobacillus niacini]|uniref:FAD synthetase family protein n=1 Tax=Neobacillus niacini TaxID=86668 RepID=UPI0030027AA2